MAECRVFIEHKSRSNEFAVKPPLLLPGEIPVTGDHGPVLRAAFEWAVALLGDQGDTWSW